MAVTSVFGTPELLETILLELPIKDLLINAQRVDKTFNGTIQASAKLQQALFFKPLPGKPLNFEKTTPPQWLESPDDERYHTVLANPFYNSLRSILLATPGDHPIRPSRLLQRPEASWRRMLVTQPPITVDLSRTSMERMRMIPDSEGQFYEDYCEPGQVELLYREASGGSTQQCQKMVDGFRFEHINRDAESTLQDYQISGVYFQTVKIYGDARWETVQDAWAVRRITGPKPDWLLRTKEAMADWQLWDEPKYKPHHYFRKGWAFGPGIQRV